MQSTVENLTSLRQIGQILLRHKGKMSAVFLASLSAAIAVTAIMQPAYRSEAKLFVRLGRENAVLDPTATIGQGPVLAMPHSREEEINSVVEILQSEVLLRQLVAKFGANKILGRPDDVESHIAATQVSHTTDSSGKPASTVNAAALEGPSQEVSTSLWSRIGPGPEATPEEQALAKLRKRVMAFAPKKSNVITLRYDGPSPQLSQAVVNELVDLYLSQHITLNRTPRSHDFFADQTDELRSRLNQSEQQLRDMQDETGISSVSEQRHILVERLGELEDDKLSVDTSLAVATAELTSLEKRLQVLPESLEVARINGLANQAFDLMRQRLYDLQLKEQQLLSVFKEEAIQVREIRREIVEARKILDEEEQKSTSVTMGKNKAYEETEMKLHEHRTEVASLQAKAEKLREQVQFVRKDLEQLNHHSMRLAQLERDVDLQDVQFRAYARNLEQARIDQALETNRISNIGLVQPATIDRDPVRPNKLANLGLGVLLGGFASLCLALAAEYFDRTLKTVEEVEERLGLPALGWMPNASSRSLAPNGKKGAHDQPLPR